MAIEILKRTQCRNIVLLEKGSGIGGTWNDNKYPGCHCDVASSLYSYSFEQKSDWSREYPGQEEILVRLIHAQYSPLSSSLSYYRIISWEFLEDMSGTNTFGSTRKSFRQGGMMLNQGGMFRCMSLEAKTAAISSHMRFPPSSWSRLWVN